MAWQAAVSRPAAAPRVQEWTCLLFASLSSCASEPVDWVVPSLQRRRGASHERLFVHQAPLSPLPCCLCCCPVALPAWLLRYASSSRVSRQTPGDGSRILSLARTPIRGARRELGDFKAACVFGFDSSPLRFKHVWLTEDSNPKGRGESTLQNHGRHPTL